ncbi:MAG TPA: FHA domain-containing protein [Dongiaceae bacterium]|nr:FHA domain-containing protein [Dongiaceae bacterium]
MAFVATGAGNVLVLNQSSVVRSCPKDSLQPGEFARFIVLSTPLRGLELVLKPKRDQIRWYLGSDKGADFTISDGTLHPCHLKIENYGEEWLLTSHRDCWGFFVNDEPLETAVIEHGDRLRIGRHELVFVGARDLEEDLDVVPSSWWSRLFHRAS